MDLVKARYPGRKADFHALEYDSKKRFDDYEMTLKPNGHILGSAQLLLSCDGMDYGVTSDFRLHDSLLFRGAEPMRCETLVLETTFGAPAYVFPPYEKTVEEMVSWIRESSKRGLVLLAGYSLGKAQELTRISNDAGFVPLVHEKIFEMNEIYRKHGVKLGKYERLDHNLKDHSVLIMPPQLVDRHLFSTLEHFDRRKIFSALATGWEYRGYFDRVFPLSNHADYGDLMAYVERASPKLVLTDHGFCEDFARKLNRKGFNAKPLEHHKQRLMSEFANE
jgi:DNA ligase-1